VKERVVKCIELQQNEGRVTGGDHTKRMEEDKVRKTASIRTVQDEGIR
jgi:hypothetical protein